MTKDKTNVEAIQAVVSAIANAKNIVATSKIAVADIVPEIIKGLTSGDFDKVARILFQKVGKVSFYQLYLASYFEACHVLLRYNVKKDIFTWYGDFNSLKKLSYSDFLASEKLEKEKAKASITKEEKLEKRFSSAFEKLDKASLEYLANKIKSILKTKLN